MLKKIPPLLLSKIASVSAEKETLDLALTYYKLGEYSNPLRIESLFSCITVLTRSLLNKDYIETKDLKMKIKDILQQRDSKFDELMFEENWKNSYSDERCSIAHGKGSKLIDPRMSAEYDKLVNTVGYWTREVIYYYIDKFKVSS